MNISEAKQIDIVDFLEKKEFSPHHRKGNIYWYCSPYRNEDTPSFKVDKVRNDWYDFGDGTGGDLIDLGKKLYNTNDTSTVLRMIANDAPTLVNNLVRTRNAPAKHQQESEFRNVEYGSLAEIALQSYIIRRKVDLSLAKVYCCEVHYSLRGKNYYAIAFRNRIGGYEIRNQYFKGCIGRKDITFFPYEKDNLMSECCIFEGFMDFLSYLTIRVKSPNNIFSDICERCDIIVLNTVACLKRALDVLSHYKAIHCFLDNDEAGRKTTSAIINQYPSSTIDECNRYIGCDDVNDYLVKRS